jgi:Fe-S-cluster containining protein
MDRCRYFNCSPKQVALCCINNGISLTIKELKKHASILNPNGYLNIEYLGIFPKEIEQMFKEANKKVFGFQLPIWHSIKDIISPYFPDFSELEGYESFLDLFLVLDIQYVYLTPLAKEENIKFVEKVGMHTYTKCPYYDEETKKCTKYSKRFLNCRLFPFFFSKEDFIRKEDLILCSKCNPAYCLPMKKGKSKKVEDILRENEKYKNILRKEMKENQKVINKTIGLYFAILGNLAKNNPKVKSEIKEVLFKPDIRNLMRDPKKNFLGNRKIYLLPFQQILTFLFYKEIGWSLEKSLEAIENYLSYLDSIKDTVNADIDNLLKSYNLIKIYFEDCLRLQKDLNLITENTSVIKMKIKEELKFFIKIFEEF